MRAPDPSLFKDQSDPQRKMKKAKNMAKIRKYEPKRVFLETLNGYIEAAKCKTLNNFTEVNTQ
jgi:hypothetical protein